MLGCIQVNPLLLCVQRLQAVDIPGFLFWPCILPGTMFSLSARMFSQNTPLDAQLHAGAPSWP